MDDSATYTVSDVIVVRLRTLSPPPPSCRRTQETRNETSNHDSMRPIIDSCRVFPAIRSKINLTYVQARISNLKPDQISLTKRRPNLSLFVSSLFSPPLFSYPRNDFDHSDRNRIFILLVETDVPKIHQRFPNISIITSLRFDVHIKLQMQRIRHVI